jgi:phage/plasmid primase-like uncharacterized protein
MSVVAFPRIDDGEVLRQFEAALRARDIEPPKHILADDKLHRCDAAGRNGKGDASYILHLDGCPAGGFRNFRDGLDWENWKADTGRTLTQTEQDALRRKVEASRAQQKEDETRRQEEAASRAADIWQQSSPCDRHPYLSRKGVQPHGVKVSRGELVIPVRDGDSKLHSLQFIRDGGEKKFLWQGRKSGCHYIIGEPGEVFCIAEGFATAASVYEATGYTAVVAFDCGNLRPAAEAIRGKYPAAKIVIAADDDHLTRDQQGNLSNPGIEKAREAAAAINGAVAVPVFGPDRPDDANDFNDLARLAGPEAVRAAIRKALDETSNETAAEPKQESQAGKPNADAEVKKPQAQILLEIAEANVELFHAPDDTAYVDINVNGHRETCPIKSKAFRLWLTRRYYEARRGAPNAEALQSALAVLEAKARFAGDERDVHVRLGRVGDRLYLDLGNPSWRAVEIDSDGWRIVAEPPIRFRRPKGMLALPEPKRGGDLKELRRFLNIRRDDDFILVVAWIVAAFRDIGPYPVLVLVGEHGTAKTTLCKILRALLDPRTPPLRSLPREERDLYISATNQLIVAIDNVSTLPLWLSDAFCRIATGGGFGTRSLFTDDEEMLFDVMRPQILNGIEDFAVRPDLADRALAISLATIPETERRSERELLADYQREQPLLLGALMTAVSVGLRNLPNVKLTAKPRMADFAEWIVACEPALPWPGESFIRAYAGNQEAIVETTLQADPFATAIRSFMESRDQWEGTATQLLDALNKTVNETTQRAKIWPKAASVLGNRLRRIAPDLRKVGIEANPDRGNGKQRTIFLSRTPPERSGKTPSLPSSPSFHEGRPSKINGLGNDGNDSSNDGNDSSNDSNDSSNDGKPIDLTHCNNSVNDSNDGDDSKMRPLSGGGGWSADWIDDDGAPGEEIEL